MWRCRVFSHCAIFTGIRDAGYEYFTVCTSVKWYTGTVIAFAWVGTIFSRSILARACLLTFIYTVGAVLPSWTGVVASTVAGVAIPCVYAGASIQAGLGSTKINVFTAGGPSPPRGTVAGESWDVSNHNIRANPTI